MQTWFKRLGAVVLFGMLAAACGGGDSTDIDAYCELVRQGTGIGADDSTPDAEEFDLLLDVAPEEIRDALRQLRNTTRSLSEIEDIDELFEAAFDPDAQEARQLFTSFAVDTCAIDEDALPAGRVASTGDLIDDIRSYVDANFSGEDWVPKVRFDIERQDGALHDLSITFVIEADADQALQACNAMSVYLYAIRSAEGEVSVVDDGLTVVRRAGPDATCEEV